MNRDAVVDATAIVDTYFPNCSIALLAGSLSRGDYTKMSDLDLIIINEDGSDLRKSFIANGWPVEAFIHTFNSYSLYLELDRQNGIPLYTRMYSEAVIIKDKEGKANNIQQQAKVMLEQGPESWSKEKINDIKYILTDLLTDLKGSNQTHEEIFIINSLVQVLHEFILRINKQWIGEGKWALRSLRAFDPELSDQLCTCILQFYIDNQKEPLIHFCETILSKYGGKVFDGYSGTSLL